MKTKRGFYLGLIVVVGALLLPLVGALCAAETPPPAVPWGLEKNRAFPQAITEYLEREIVSKVTDVSFDTPQFATDHGSYKPGEKAWQTSEEELLGFLESLPKDFLRWDVVGNVTTYSEEGDRKPMKSFKVPLAVFSKPPLFDAEELRALGKPVFFIEAQIHGDETSAGEATLTVMQKLATDEWDILKDISIVVLPRYCVDGAWFYQRGTQTIRGMGSDKGAWFKGLDQNRDHAAFFSPLTRLQATILNAYKPEFGLDLHEMGWTEIGTERVVSGDEMVEHPAGAKRYYRHAMWNPINAGAAFPNLPRSLLDWNTKMVDYVTKELKEKRGIYTFPYYTSHVEMRVSQDIEVVKDGQVVLVSGDITKHWAAVEVNPDEAYGDAIMGIKPMIELCCEVPAAKHLSDGYKARLYGHYSGMEYCLKFAAQNAASAMKDVTAAREAMAADREPVILWFSQAPREAKVKALEMNAARDQVIGIKELTIPYYYDNMNIKPVKTATRPWAYLLDGTALKADAAAFRLAYTGIPVLRLTEPVTMEVEKYVVDEVIAGDDPSLVTWEWPSWTTVDGTPEPQKPGENYRGSPEFWPFRLVSHLINKVTASVEKKDFPAGTYVIPMDHVYALHASLVLEPLGNRSYGNYFLTHSADQYGNADPFFPVAVGKDYPAYRYMSEKELPTERVFAEQPLLRDAVYAEGYPVSAATLKEKGFGLPADDFALAYHFRAEAPNALELHPRPEAFTLLVPKKSGERTLSSWFFYDWDKKDYVSLEASTAPSGARSLELKGSLIGPKGEVIALGFGL